MPFRRWQRKPARRSARGVHPNEVQLRQELGRKAAQRLARLGQRLPLPERRQEKLRRRSRAEKWGARRRRRRRRGDRHQNVEQPLAARRHVVLVRRNVAPNKGASVRPGPFESPWFYGLSSAQPILGQSNRGLTLLGMPLGIESSIRRDHNLPATELADNFVTLVPPHHSFQISCNRSLRLLSPSVHHGAWIASRH
jgi:hypothetical protein